MNSVSLSLLSLPLTLAHTPVLSPSHPSHHMLLYWDHSRATHKWFMCTVRPIIAVMFVVSFWTDSLLGAHPVEDFKNTAVSESSLSFSWSQPSIAENLTTGYNLTCVPLLTGIPLSQSLKLAPTATSATVAGLRSGVTYNCSIFTITDQGHSQPLTLSNSTSETGTVLNSWKLLWVKTFTIW